MQAPSLAFSAQWRVKCLVSACQVLKSRLPTLLVEVGREHGFFSCGVGCSRIAVVQKFSVLLGCPFPGPVGREIRVLLGPFCVCALWYFQVLGILGPMSAIYEAKENSGNSPQCCFRGPEVPRRKVSPPFFLGLFYIMFGVFSCTQWEEQTKCVYSIFLVAGGLR